MDRAFIYVMVLAIFCGLGWVVLPASSPPPNPIPSFTPNITFCFKHSLHFTLYKLESIAVWGFNEDGRETTKFEATVKNKQTNQPKELETQISAVIPRQPLKH